jgi:hypothetical protein
MPRACTICTHSQRDDIDRALLSFSASYRNIAQQFQLEDHTSLHRHLSNCLRDEYALAKREQAERTVTTIQEIAGVLTQIMRGQMTDLFNECGRFDIDDIRDRGLGGLIKSVTIEQNRDNNSPADVIKVEMYSRLDAAKSLASMWVKLKINDDANRRVEAQRQVARQNLEEYMSIGLSFDEAIVEVERDLPGARLLLNG